MKALILILLFCAGAHAKDWEYRTSETLAGLSAVPWIKHPVQGSVVAREFEGYIEYRTVLESSELHTSNQIYLGRIGDADKVFLNGSQIGQTGNFPPAFSYNMDSERSYFIPDTFIKNGHNELTILVYSKFLVNKGFNPKSFKLTEAESTKYTSELTNNLSKIIIPVLCLVLATVSFPLLAPKHLWNTQVMIFVIAISSFFLGVCRGRILYHYFEMLPIYKLTLASSIFTIWIVTTFMTRTCTRLAKFVPTIIAASLMTIILIASSLKDAAALARVWFHISPLFLLFALYGTIRAKRSYLRICGLVVLIGTNLNDNLNDLWIISTTSLLQIGLGAFIICMILDQLLTLKRSWEKYFMKEAQLEIDAAIGKQAIQIAHDLRSPLEAIKIGIGKIQSIPDEDEKSLKVGFQRINEICESLLGEHKLRNFIFTTDELTHAVKDVIEEASYKYGREIKVHLCLAGLRDELTFEIDSTQFKRTICNLLTNAVEANNYTGDVYVSLNSDANFIKIDIQDNGAGVPLDIDQLFERGYTTKANGNGLGLSSAKNFVESIGGMINLSRLHQGTLVSLMIPASLMRRSNYSTSSQNIVLIDDDSLVRFNWRRQGQSANISVHTFENLNDFLCVKSRFSLDTPIYIDSNLGEEKR